MQLNIEVEQAHFAIRTTGHLLAGKLGDRAPSYQNNVQGSALKNS
jgi:hypothetical protein